MPVLSYPDARELDWDEIAKDPRRVTKMVRWHRRSIYSDVVRGSLFFIAALDQMNNKAERKYGVGVQIIQTAYNTDIAASEGTHDRDNCIDWYIPGVDTSEAQRFGRFECGMATWARWPWQGFRIHNHGFFLPPGGHVFPFTVGKYIDGGRSLGLSGYSSQLDDYWRNAYGLAGMHNTSSDPTPFPTREAKMAGIFDLDRYIQVQREHDMEYKEWSKESKEELAGDVAKAVTGRLLDIEGVTLKNAQNEAVGKIPLRAAVQRILNR